VKSVVNFNSTTRIPKEPQIIIGALDGLMPNVTLYLDVEPEVGLQWRVDVAGSMAEVQAQL